MSTNYYFKVDSDCPFCKDKTIHIGKRSVGWKPIFEKTDYYSSVKEIEKFYKNNKNNLTIIDEYYEELTYDELYQELILWGSNKEEVVICDGGDYLDSDGYSFVNAEFS